jgi:hypothetical protein
MPIFWLFENAYLFAYTFVGSFEKKPYLLPFTYPPDVRKEKFCRSKPSPISRISSIRRTLL